MANLCFDSLPSFCFFVIIFNAKNPECRGTPVCTVEGEEKTNTAHLSSLQPSYCRGS